MPIDPRTLAPIPPPTAAPSPDVVRFDGGGPTTAFTDTIDGGSPGATGTPIDGDEGTS